MVSKHTDDPMVIKTFSQEEWFKYSSFNNLELFLKHSHSITSINNDNYEMKKHATEKQVKHTLSKKDLFDSKNAKTLCRNGVPYMYIKDFLSKMFSIGDQLEDTYKIKKDKVLKSIKITSIKEYVPYFCGGDLTTIEKCLPVHYLTPDGINSVKEIQWMLNSVIPNIEYCPMLINVNALLHNFCKPFEVYLILRNLLNINYNLKDTHLIRWHFRFTYQDHQKLISSIVECLKEISHKSGKNTIEHLNNIQFNPNKLIEDMINNFFMNYLTIEGVMRLLVFYLREGVKSMYRLAYALVKHVSPALLEVKDSTMVIKTFQEKSLEITDFIKLFDSAYSFNLTRNNNKYDFQENSKENFSNGINSFYLPKITYSSSLDKKDLILNNDRLINIWSQLPFNIRTNDIEMVYHSNLHGYNLESVYECNKKILDENLNTVNDYKTLFLIQTGSNEILGGFMSRMMYFTSNKFERPYDSLLLYCDEDDHKFKFYDNVTGHDDIIYCDNDCVMFGNGDKGPAIRIDKDVKHAFSYESKCFDSPVLTKDQGGEYDIRRLEIYLIG